MNSMSCRWQPRRGVSDVVVRRLFSDQALHLRCGGSPSRRPSACQCSRAGSPAPHPEWCVHGPEALAARFVLADPDAAHGGQHGVVARRAAIAPAFVQRAPFPGELDHLQEVRGGDVDDGLAAEPGKHVQLQPANDGLGAFLGPGGQVLGVPFARHHLEAVCYPGFLRGLLRPAVLTGIDVVGQQLAGLAAALAGVLQGNIGVDAKRQPLFLASVAVLQSPPLAPRKGGLPDTARRRRTASLTRRSPAWT